MEPERFDPVARRYRADATLWVWIVYGLAQAAITMLGAFDVLETFTAAEVTTAVALIAYVAVNELIVRPGRRRRPSEAPQRPVAGLEAPDGTDPPAPPI